MVGTMIAAALVGATTGFAYYATAFIINYAVSYVVTRAFGVNKPGKQTDMGMRQQVPPAANNPIPIVYGDAWLGGTFVDAVLSTDNKTMYYVLVISNISADGQFFYRRTDPTTGANQFYYGDRLITFDGTDPTKVVALTDGAGNVDTKVSGNLYINLYTSDLAGNITPVTGSAPSVVMGGADITPSLRWPATSTRQMNGLAFAIVKLIYNSEAGTTGLQPITFKVSHYLKNTGAAKPGDVLSDYLTSTVYGCSVPLANVNTTACAALNTYSDEVITFAPYTGGTATQPRYRINGVLNTGENALANIDKILVACDSWLAYQETTGQWMPVINKADATALAFNDSNIIGELRVSVSDLSQSINKVEATFPWKDNKDQPGIVFLETPSALLYPNEPVNKATISLDLVNDSIQAQYLANRMLEQAREDLIVTFSTAYTGIQADAGDVISITNSEYGWTDKLFRVMRVSEVSLPDGNLGAQIECSEYNAAVYDNQDITQFTPAPNSNLASAFYFSALAAPTVGDQAPSAAVPSFSVTCNLPTTGRVTTITLFYTTSATPSVTDWKVWGTEEAANSQAYTPGLAFKFPNITLPAATYYFAFKVANEVATSQLSAVSTALVWAPTAAVGPTGPTGDTGNKTARAVVYQWAISIPAGPAGTSTYTWSTGTFTPDPAGWPSTITDPPSPGFTLWSATVSLIAANSATTSTISWTSASIVSAGYAGITGPTGSVGPTGAGGATGPTGAQARLMYARIANNPTPVAGTVTVSGDNKPSAAQAGAVWGAAFAVTWYDSDPNPSSNDSLYQADGIFNGTNTVWSAPYISALKVGTLSAITVNTGALTVQNTLTVSSTGNIQGGQTGYNTGIGFFLGYSSTTYKFSIGSSTQSLLWDGSTLSITGNFVGKSALFNGSTTVGSSTATVIIKPSTTSGANSLTVEGTGAGYAIGVSSDSTTTAAISSQGFWYGVEGIGFAAGTSRASIGVRGVGIGINTIGGQFEESGEATSYALRAVGKAEVTGTLYVGSSSLSTSSSYLVANGILGHVQTVNGTSTLVTVSDRFGPIPDNTISLGGVGSRWSVVYAATGTINTSDERDKTILGSSLGLAFINALEPISYKWKFGGVDADGNPRPGVRTFHGLKAQQVKTVVDSMGVDFAGWTLADKDDPTSQQGLRYTEFIAPLIKAVQELSQKVADLEARLK